ncbi:MAG: hypothetical protein MUF25_16000 [Pirellulaceae bacterium]|jgi:hypothetical protein|nr:hypothetical protein [Pirellulaceae bacterium]
MGNTRAVRVIMYDLRDHPQKDRREAVLRISGSEGELLLQGRCYGDDPRGLGQRIADGLGVDYVYVGPADAVGIVTAEDCGADLPAASAAEFERVAMAAAVMPARREFNPAAKPAGWLF